MGLNSILYVFRYSAWQGRRASDGLDLLMASCAMELDVSALFIHEGVFILKREQRSLSVDESAPQAKLASKPFGALYDFGCEHVYVCERSLKARGLTVEDLFVQTSPLQQEDIAACLDRFDQVVVV